MIDFEQKIILPLTKEELKSNQDAKVCYICAKRMLRKLSKATNYQKVRDHCPYTDKYGGSAHSICNLKLNVPNKIPVVFHNDSKYDYPVIIKELANEFERKFECLWENKEKCKTFSVPIEKEVAKTDKDGYESVVTIIYKMELIDSARLMASSLSNFVYNLAEGIYKNKCKDCDCFLEYKNVKSNLIKYKCLPLIKIIQTNLMKN